MLRTMAYTQTDLDRINAAIASGTLTVRSGDDAITYQSLDDMLRIKREIQAALNQTANASRLYPRHQLASFADD